MRRHERRVPKLTALMLIPIMALAMLGITYGYWREKLQITGTVTIGKWHQIIGSSKIVKPAGYDENRSIVGEILPNRQIFQLICANVSDGWHIWVGLLIQNNGTIPTSVKEPSIHINYNQNNFTIKTYFYGPYERGEHKEVWGKVKMYNLPFEGWKWADITLNSYQKAVIWIEFEFNCTDQKLVVDMIEIQITIQYDLAV